MIVYSVKTGEPLEANESYAARLVEQGEAIYGAKAAPEETPKEAPEKAPEAEPEKETGVEPETAADNAETATTPGNGRRRKRGAELNDGGKE